MNNKLILLGGGGHCISVLDTIERMGTYSDVVILDPNIKAGTLIAGHEVVGDDNVIPELKKNGFDNAFITTGSIVNTDIRRHIYSEISKYQLSFPNIIDPSSVVSSYAKLGKGVFVGKKAIINAMAEIDDMVIINTGAIIEHECHIGEFTHIAVGAVVCGGTSIGKDSFIGANTTVIQGLNLKDRSFYNAGATVLK